MRINKTQQNATVCGELDSKQISAVAGLTAGGSVTDVARQIGVDRSTIYRWLNEDPVFLSELNKEKQEQLRGIRAELSSLAQTATKTLRELLLTENTPSAVKLKAAATILQAVGVLVPEPLGSTDPEQIRSEQATNRLLTLL